MDDIGFMDFDCDFNSESNSCCSEIKKDDDKVIRELEAELEALKSDWEKDHEDNIQGMNGLEITVGHLLSSGCIKNWQGYSGYGSDRINPNINSCRMPWLNKTEREEALDRMQADTQRMMYNVGQDMRDNISNALDCMCVPSVWPKKDSQEFFDKKADLAFLDMTTEKRGKTCEYTDRSISKDECSECPYYDGESDYSNCMRYDLLVDIKIEIKDDV